MRELARWLVLLAGVLLVILYIVAGRAVFGQNVLPTVPGLANPAVTQSNIKTTICRSDWTKTIRPPASYTNRLKLAQMRALGLRGKPGDYEEDHLISLELGGHPTDPRNLWPEPYAPRPGARQKDQVEDFLHRQVCSGKVSLADAQKQISTDWYAVFLTTQPNPTK